MSLQTPKATAISASANPTVCTLPIRTVAFPQEYGTKHKVPARKKRTRTKQH